MWKDFKWVEKRFGTKFASILKGIKNTAEEGGQEISNHFITSETGEVTFKDLDDNSHVLVTTEALQDEDSPVKELFDESVASVLAKNGLIEVKWEELKDKRDNGELIPGSLYRITDYNCTTTQENTRSAGNQFDIVLLALREDKLAEEGWAMMHDNIYDVTFSDGVTKKCYIYKYVNVQDFDYNIVDVETKLGVIAVSVFELQINEENKTASTEDWAFTELTDENITYNYFQNSNLSAWKVWYCLDNDTNRFAWADAGSEYIEISVSGENKGKFYRSQSDDTTLTIGGGTYNLYAWKNPDLNSDNIYYTWQTDSPIEDTVLRNAQGAQYSQDFTRIVKCAYKGRGVIYRLIDEFNNDVPYDFKNIQYVRKLTDGTYDPANGTNTWVYTFSLVLDGVEDIQDFSLKIYGTTDNDEVWGAFNNVIKSYNLGYNSEETGVVAILNSIVFVSTNLDMYDSCINNIINCECKDITLGTTTAPSNNTFIGKCLNINITDRCYNNFISMCNNIQVDYISNSSFNSCSNIFLDSVENSTFCNVTDVNDSPKQVIGIVGSSVLNNLLSMILTLNCTNLEVENSASININKYVESVRIHSCNNVTLTSTQNTTSTQRIKNVNIKNVVNKTISHNTLNDTFVTTYVPQDSTTVEV